MDEFEKVYYYVHYVYNLQARRPVIREDYFAWVMEQKIPRIFIEAELFCCIRQ